MFVFLTISDISVSFIKMSYTDSSTSLSIPTPLEAFPCGSASIINTLFPFFASIVLKLIEVVVFPTPPF